MLGSLGITEIPDAAKCAVSASRNVKCWGVLLLSLEPLDSHHSMEQQVRVHFVCVDDWVDGFHVRLCEFRCVCV